MAVSYCFSSLPLPSSPCRMPFDPAASTAVCVTSGASRCAVSTRPRRAAAAPASWRLRTPASKLSPKPWACVYSENRTNAGKCNITKIKKKSASSHHFLFLFLCLILRHLQSGPFLRIAPCRIVCVSRCPSCVHLAAALLLLACNHFRRPWSIPLLAMPPLLSLLLNCGAFPLSLCVSYLCSDRFFCHRSRMYCADWPRRLSSGEHARF